MAMAMATDEHGEHDLFHRELPRIACERLLDPGSYLLRQPPPEESKKRKTQLVYRSTTTTDLLRNPSLKFITVSQPDGTFVVGAHRVTYLHQVPPILKGMRTADGTTLVAAVRRKVYELSGKQFVVHSDLQPLGYGEQADTIHLGSIPGRNEHVALKQHPTLAAAWNEYLAMEAAQGPGVCPVFADSVDSTRPILALYAFKERQRHQTSIHHDHRLGSDHC